MKRNIILVGILSSLLLMTYFFQEKRVEKEHVEADLKDQLINFELKHLKLPAFEAEKEDGRWWFGKELLSFNGLSQFEKKLTQIKKLKEIDGDWKVYFNHPLNFEINHEPWAIGDTSLDKQSFYISRNKKIYLAYIDGGSHELVQDENQVAETKLNELKTILQASFESLKEKQLFRFFPDLSFDRIIIKAQGIPGYELNFVDNSTVPKPVHGITVHEGLKGKFLSLFTQMMIQKEVPYTNRPYFKKLCELQLIDSEGEIRSWELWQESKKQANPIITDHGAKRSFLVVGGTMKVFFTHFQEYWDRKVIPPSSFKSFTKLDLTMMQGKKSGHVQIINKEPLDFNASGFKANIDNLQKLMDIVFNIGEWDQADRVSPLSPTERQEVLSGNYLRFEVFGQDLLMWQKKEELIVVNLTQKFKAHYGIYVEKFRASFDSMLE